MEYRLLGRSGLKVSRLCLGTMMFGGATDAATSQRLIGRAAEAGCNFLDTADVYNAGRSEEVIGEALAGSRADWVLATKLGNAFSNGLNQSGLSRRWIMQAVEASLRRLRTDWIDILYLHREDLDTPLETTVVAIADLVRAGKLRHFGLSNFRAWRVAAVCEFCDRMGIDRPVVNQPNYSIMNRQPEVEVIPVSVHYGMAVFPYSPLARGILTAKYRPGEAAPTESRAGRKDRRMMETEWRPESLAIAQRIKTHAESVGTTPSHFAIAWVLNNSLVAGTICGPRTEAHLEDYLAALDYRFTAADEALVEELVAPGHPSSPGFNDPQYPIEGRKPMTGASFSS
jgi:aryl-alcohol dehydrogenase-like predicted oxidoreductase